MEDKQYFVYIMSNEGGTVLYTGVTNDLKRRIAEHKQGIIEGFTKKYNVKKLLYFEVFDNPENAIRREKQLKAGSRRKKIDMIVKSNNSWEDLSEEI